ncbi:MULTISPECIES: 3-oxoacyl-ACP synthase III family protein [Streptomyces]|uniref:3-oxoacyl-ACP synthase III n=1 Tax=Streptomyces albus (strain ATCC 21838 / DSM 41398 / FERM P-419 / JCM 4703 / NBRC 107858) TaxID=1081613 RepID=A0A0B5EV81_STRA4|nr:3-oxoacyl-[acyl-carrier-protein] synthase III C-terminal domain-containing protein [Streptomyces sp. SCSIO ZS0520]AJE83150.1 3-oxoacyl-ACP synthase III [Streptomyces albus]AOU77461.1 3-oxoacyl-ACP synthase III [Streptomyces albus]
MIPVSLVDVDSYLPERSVGTEFYTGGTAPDSEGAMFGPPLARRHAAPEESATDMAVAAAQGLLERRRARGDGPLDVLLTNVALPDRAFTGAGADIAARLGLDPVPEWIIDVHNSGCAAFVHLMKIGRALIASGQARTALICCVQNMAGQVFARPGVRGRKHAPVPGDGCGVGYLKAGDESPILDVVTHHGVEYANDMSLSADTRKYWEPGEGEIDIGFTDSKVKQIVARGNQLVPQVTRELCERLGTPTTDIDLLVTNQPNRMFLSNWHQELGLKPERHPDTFDRYGNLFGAGIPVTLTHARDEGSVRKGDLVVLSGFAHAGDFAAAAAVRW